MISRLLWVVSQSPVITSYDEVGVDVMKILDRSPSSIAFLLYPFHVKSLTVQKLLQKSEISARGRIDITGLLNILSPDWVN